MVPPQASAARDVVQPSSLEALRARKTEIGLSNNFIEHALHMGAGGLDKVLGPSRVKGLSLPVALDLLELLGCRLRIEVDSELEAKMAERYERRSECSVRQHRRISKAIMERVKPVLFAELGRDGGKARARSLPAKQRREIARNAALVRWRLHRAAVKARANAATECGVAP
jgi:hypothetical protein